MARPVAPIAFLLALVTPMAARAERPVTFSEALEASARANPAVAAAAYDVDAADAGLRSAKGFLDPTLDANVGWRRSQDQGFFQGFPYKAVSQYFDMGVGISGTTPIGTQWQFDMGLDRNLAEYSNELPGGVTESVEDAWFSNTSISLRQPLLRGILVGWNMQNVSVARDRFTIAELSQERTRQDTLADAAAAYWTFAYLQELEHISVTQVEAATEALRVGQLRRESGEIAPVEQTRLEAALVSAQQEQLAAEISADQAADRLLLLMGEDPGQELVPATPIGDVPPIMLDVGAAVEVGVAQNLDLAVARAQVETARSDYSYAKHGRLPELAAVASAGIGAQDTNAGGAIGGMFGDEAFPFLAIGGELSVPLGNRVFKGQAQSAEADLYKSEAQLEELERTIRASIEHQVRVLQQAGYKVELADVNVRLAEETLAAEEALERAGRAIQKDVLEARTEVYRARAEATRARADYLVAQTELLHLQGQIDLAMP